MIEWGSAIFGPFLYKSSLNRPQINDLLAEARKCKVSYNHFLAGQLDDQYRYPKSVQDWFYSEVLNEHIQEYRKGLCLHNDQPDLEVVYRPHDLWVNFMKAGDFNPVHTHSGDLSFVTYLEMPEKLEEEQNKFEGTGPKPGYISFEFGYQVKPKWAVTGNHFAPKVGDLFIFPALLQHWVSPFKSPGERISISGNLSINNRENLPNDYF